MRPLGIAATAIGTGALAIGGAVAIRSLLNQGNGGGIIVGPHDPPKPPQPPAGVVKTDKPGLDMAVAQTFNGREVPTYELKLPASGEPPKGVVLAIHGGAWIFVGPGAIRAVDADVARWNARGYATVNIDYHAGAESMQDVLRFYDAVRKWQGDDIQIGATGQSAGGHLSMYIAAHRPELAFVVSNGGPSDLTRLAGATDASKSLQEGVRQLFGNDNLDDHSPALNAARMGARLLVANAANDQLVLPDQARYMRESRPDLAETLILDAGDKPYVHANVSQASLDKLYAAEERIAAATR